MVIHEVVVTECEKLSGEIRKYFYAISENVSIEFSIKGVRLTNMNTMNNFGQPQILYKRKWFLLSYLQYKDVLKICSFMNYNFGTVKLKQTEGFHGFSSILETIDCSENATSIHDCQLKYKKYN